jgi:hypothetical protein
VFAAVTPQGRVAQGRGHAHAAVVCAGLDVALGTLALPVLGTLKEYPPGNILVPFVYLRVLRVPYGYLRVPSGYSSTQSSQISQFAFLRVHWLPHCRGIPRQWFFFRFFEYPISGTRVPMY